MDLANEILDYLEFGTTGANTIRHWISSVDKNMKHTIVT